MKFEIRPAVPADAGAILGLIHELAVYEKEPDAVKTTEEDFLRDGFGDTPIFHCLVAESEGTVLGFALYFFTWSTWEGRPSLYLEDLYVREAARGHQLGYSLFKRLAEIAVKKKCQRYEWTVLDWNQSARDFYHKLGAFHMEGWLPYRLEAEALVGLSKASKT